MVAHGHRENSDNKGQLLRHMTTPTTHYDYHKHNYNDKHCNSQRNSRIHDLHISNNDNHNNDHKQVQVQPLSRPQHLPPRQLRRHERYIRHDNHNDNHYDNRDNKHHDIHNYNHYDNRDNSSQNQTRNSYDRQSLR